MNEELIGGYAAYTAAEEFGAGAEGEAPGTTISSNWTPFIVTYV